MTTHATNPIRMIALCGLGVLLTSIMVFPVYWLIVTSLTPTNEIFKTSLSLFPAQIDWEPYTRNLVQNQDLLRYMWNSLLLGVGTMGLSIILGAPLAYALARFPIHGKIPMVFSMLVLQMFPSIMLAVPLFAIFTQFHMMNSLGSVILATTSRTLPFAVLVLRPYFMNLPRELEDAAAIDGCNRLQAFLRVILPLSLPGLATVAAFNFLSGWSEFIFSLTLLTDDAKRPIAIGLYRFISLYGVQWNNLMAASVIVSIPALLFFVFAQRYLIAGLTVGSKNE